MLDEKLIRQAQCLLNGHRWGAFELRPPRVARPIEWMYWHRSCDRCKKSENRWFRVKTEIFVSAIPYLTAEEYLQEAEFDPPDPMSLPTGAPAEMKPQK